MNLFRTQKALLAVQRREQRQLWIHRAANEVDVREMVQEGLLTATFGGISPHSAIVPSGAGHCPEESIKS